MGSTWLAMKSKLIEIACVSVLLAAVSVFIFWDVVDDSSEPEYLGTGDSWTYAGPIQFFNDYALDSGIFPQWNPLMLTGQPHVGNPQSFLLYPPNLLRSFLTSDPTPIKTHTGIILLIFLHILVGGIGQYMFARRYGLSVPAAWIAVMVFELSAPSVSRAIGHWYFHFSIVWIPWLLWAAHGFAMSGKWSVRFRSLLVGSILYSLVILAGAPHLSMLIGLFLGAYVLLVRLFLYKRDADSSSPEPNTRVAWFGVAAHESRILDLGISVLGLLLLCVFSILFAMPQVLPTIEFSKNSARGMQKDIEFDEAAISDSSKDWNALSNLLVYSGNSDYEGLKGAGACALILAVLALLSTRRRVVAAFGILFLIFLDGSRADSWFLWKLMQAISPYSLDSPGRAMLIACQPLGMLAGLGLDAVIQSNSSKRHKATVAGAIAIVVVGVYYNFWRITHPEPYIEVPYIATLAPIILGVVLVAASILGRPRLFGVLISAIVLVEISIWARTAFLPSVMPESILYSKSMDALRDPQHFWANNSRGTYSKPNEPIYRLEPAINGYDPLHLAAVRAFICAPNLASQYSYTVSNMGATGYNPRGLSLMKRSFWLSRQYANADPLPAATKFPVATTTFLHTNVSLPVTEVKVSDLRHAGVSDGFGKLPLHDSKQGKITLKTSSSLLDNESVRMTFRKPNLHTTMVLAVSSDCEAELWSYIGDKQSIKSDGDQQVEMGAIYGIKPTDGKIVYVEIPLPDYDVVQFAIIAQNENPGTVTIHEIFLAVDRNDETEHIAVLHRDANSVRVKIEKLPAPRILTFLDANYEGWTATLDGVRVPIIEAYGVFKAVSVPVGTHTVEFRFRDPKFWTGLYISAIFLIFSVTAWFVAPRILDR
jgi:hypothetical protein